MKWPKVKLGDVCEIVSGATPKTGVQEYWNGDICWATPTDLSALKEKYIASTERKITELGLSNCAAKILPANSVLFTSRAPIGLVAINAVPMATNQGFKSFVPLASKLDKGYLYWWLLVNRSYINAMGVGATFKEVSKSIVERIEIPLPSIAEQKLITAILDKAADISAKRTKAIAKLDEIAQSTFSEIFQQDLSNSKSVVDDFFEVNVNRYETNLKDSDKVSFVPMSAVSEVSKSIESEEIRTYAEVKKGYTPIKKGDLIVAKITPCYENGKQAIANVSTQFAYGSTEFHTFRSNSKELLTLLHYYLQTNNVMRRGAANMKGAAGQRRVPDSFFRTLPFARPEDSKLNMFYSFICKLNEQRESLVKQQEVFQAAMKSLQHQAFSRGFDA